MSSTIPGTLLLAGHRKSGTTLLLSLLDGHPGLCVYPDDLRLLYAYHPAFVAAHEDREARAARLERILFTELAQRPQLQGGLRIGALRQAFEDAVRDTPLDVADVLPALVRAFAATHPAPTPGAPVVLKETSVEIHAARVDAWLPGARFVHLLRDPRDNYGALKSGLARYYSGFGDDERTLLHSLIERAGLGLRMAETNLRRFGPGRYLVLRFEDLVREPEPTLRRLCAFAGLDFDPCLLRPTRAGGRDTGNSFEGRAFEGISADNAGRWRERILPEEACVIEYALGEVMARHGYEPAFDEAARADAMAAFYDWCNTKYHYFDRFA